MGKLVIFNGIVVYDKQKALLYNIKEPDKRTSLYAPTNKCLSLLIETRPEVISQHVFFEKVWENDGLSITANTFYQHIAMLRRAFEEVGFKNDVIVTIPRRGLSLSDKLDLSFQDQQEDGLSSTMESLAPLDTVPKEPVQKTMKRRKWLVMLPGYLIIGGFVFGLSFFFSQRVIAPSEARKSALEQYRYIGDVSGCRVSVFSSLTSLDDVRDKIKESGISCGIYNTIYYSTIPLLNRTSLIACSDNAKEGVKCLSYFLITSR